MKNLTIYDSNGRPCLRVIEKNRIVAFDASSMGFIKGKNVYDYNGTHRGFFEGGILRDHESYVVGFTENVSDPAHPFLPFKKFKPFASFHGFEPLRPFTEFPPFQTFKKRQWSDINPFELFEL